MQKNIKVRKQVHKRSHPVRALALFLALIIGFGMADLSRHGSEQQRRVAESVVPSVAFSEAILEKENETERMPVRFEDGLRTVTISGA